MKRILFSLLAFSCSVMAFSQDGKRYIGFHFSPDICYYLDNEKQFEYFGVSGASIWGMDAGFKYGVQPVNRLMLETGVSYQQMGYRTQFLFLFEDMIEPTTGFFIENFQARNSLHFIKVPLQATYRFGKPESNLAFITGVSCDMAYLLAAQTDGVGVKNFDKNYNRFNVLPGLRTGMELALQNEMIVRWELKFNFTGINVLKTNYSYHPYNLGLNFTVLLPMKP